MPADATLRSVTAPATDPTVAAGPLAPIDHVRHQVAAALFGDPTPPRALGRFQLQRLIGAGGMGVVHAATDPELGRTVAVKLLHAATGDRRARDRLIREAQAMARLQHPNVVGVLEVGTFADQVYLVMEYVDGGTLGDWLRAHPRDWRDIVDVLVQAGEGLAAAHAAGLVHRDFKPANVLMGGGRPRISDFGLARTDADAAADLEQTAGDGPLLLGAALTRTGALLGTPAYMAPEQFRGEVATAASDQYAFAVVAYEALAGHRPFTGDSVGELLAAAERGKLEPPARRVPSGVLAVLRRALAVDPARRFPGMPALLAALRRTRRALHLPQIPPLGRRVAASGLALVGGVGLFVLSTDGARVPGPPAPPLADVPLAAPPLACDADPLVGIWDESRRFHLAAALSSGTDPALGALDRYAAAWRTAHAARCAALLAGAAAGWTDTCLADRRTALADLTHAILTGTAEQRAGAHAAATELLPALVDCDQPARYLTLISEAPRDVRHDVWRMRLGFAAAFLPGVAAAATAPPPRPPGMGPNLRQDLRAVHELNFAEAVLALRDPAPGRPPRTMLTELADDAAGDGHADIAARAWVLALELLEAGPHSEGEHTRVRRSAADALALLPAAHPLAHRLRRDLGVVELAHARHTVPAGVCHREATLAVCAPLDAALADLKVPALRPDATAVDRELYARALDHAGDTARASTLHAARDLDERALGYLEFSTVLVPEAPTLATQLHCNPDATRCEVARALADEWTADIDRLLRQVRIMPSVKDGVARGLKFYGLRSGTAFNLLGFKNGDLLLALDGADIPADRLPAALAAALRRGEFTLAYERKGVPATRQISVR